MRSVIEAGKGIIRESVMSGAAGAGDVVLIEVQEVHVGVEVVEAVVCKTGTQTWQVGVLQVDMQHDVWADADAGGTEMDAREIYTSTTESGSTSASRPRALGARSRCPLPRRGTGHERWQWRMWMDGRLGG